MTGLWAAIARNAAPLGVAAGAYALAVGLPSRDPDLYWHLASGRWMLDHAALLRHDVFSYTIAGQPYSVGEWLGQVVLTLAYQAGSWQGIAVVRGVLIAIAAFFITRSALRLGAPPLAAILVAAAALALSMQSWGDRPQLFSLALFPAVLDLCLAARAGDRRALWALPPLLLLWTNLHGGYALGLAAIAAFTVEALLSRRAQARGFVVAAALSLAASFLDPGALGLGSAASHVLRPPRSIAEEMPPDVLRPAGMLLALFIAATVGLALATGGGRARLLQALLLVPILWLALSAQRHMHWYAFAAAPFLAAQGAQVWSRLRPAGMTERILPPRAAAAITLALLLVALVSSAWAPRAPDETPFPASASGALRSGSGNLLHEYDWGGWLVFRHPERPVFIDGRLFPFVPGIFDDYVEMTDLRPAWREVLDRHAIREVLLRPHRPLVQGLREAGWSVRAEEAGRWILLRAP